MANCTHHILRHPCVILFNHLSMLSNRGEFYFFARNCALETEVTLLLSYFLFTVSLTAAAADLHRSSYSTIHYSLNHISPPLHWGPLFTFISRFSAFTNPNYRILTQRLSAFDFQTDWLVDLNCLYYSIGFLWHISPLFPDNITQKYSLFLAICASKI